LGNPSHDHHPSIVVDGVHDPVLAYTDSVVVSTRESDGSRVPRLRPERIDCVGDPLAKRAL